MNEPLLTVAEASEFLRVGTGKVYALVAQGLLMHRKIGRRICFRRADLDNFIESAASVPAPVPVPPPSARLLHF
jgi:excisionase family DNA binding protein